MDTPEFPTIATREFLLRGPADRTVSVRIGVPETDPDRPLCSRCPFQVVGLSDDAIKYAVGVDSFQALSLAFAGIRAAFQKNAAVLAAFHDDFSLTWEGSPWELAFPVSISARDMAQLDKLQHFLDHDFWK